MPYSYLTLQEHVIYHLVLYDLSYREISRRLNRKHQNIKDILDRLIWETN